MTFATKVAGLLAGMTALVASVIAQTASTLEFDAASVKLATVPRDGRFSIGTRFDPEQFVGEYMTMREYILAAYTLRAGDTVIGPDWISSRDSVYNITARAAGKVPARDLKIMLRNLLASRFHLTFHVEDRPAQIYALVLGGKGIKLTPVKFDGPDPSAGSIHYIPSGTEFKHASMAMMAHALSGGSLGRVDDATGIQDLFDIKLGYATKGWEPLLDPPIDSNEPSVFAALQGIGLKLERRQGTVKAYVIDHVDREPTAN